MSSTGIPAGQNRSEHDARVGRLVDRLPARLRGPIRWLRQPCSAWIRIPSGVLLTCGGILGFLPVAGFWMLPLGLLLLAEDVPVLRSARTPILDWIERRYPHWLAAAPHSMPNPESEERKRR
jgi:hypothetical protein